MKLVELVSAAIGTVSQRLRFLREALGEKLHRPQRVRLESQVASYCAEGYADEDRDLVASQAFDRDDE